MTIASIKERNKTHKLNHVNSIFKLKRILTISKFSSILVIILFFSVAYYSGDYSDFLFFGICLVCINWIINRCLSNSIQFSTECLERIEEDDFYFNLLEKGYI